MQIDQVENYISPGGSELLLNAQREDQDLLMTRMKMELTFKDRLLKLSKEKNRLTTS